MTTLPATFVAKTKPSDCILWTGALNSRGYPCFAIDGVSQLAHRVAYEAAHGPIPEGMTIDHLCRVRHCVNPDHLEAVTGAENTRRAASSADYCVHGHPLYLRSNGKRGCRTCEATARRIEYGTRSIGAGGAPSHVVRQWALDNGMTVSPRGNLPQHVRKAFEAAQGTTTNSPRSPAG